MSFTYTYRPNSLDELAMGSSQLRAKLNAYITGENQRPLILHGDFGVGKTTIAELLPSAIEGFKVRARAINSADFVSAAAIKEVLDAPFGYYKFFSENGQKRNYITVNEMRLTGNAALVLRDYMDLLCPSVQMIFTTNELLSVDAGIRDRCTCLYVPPCSAQDWLPRAQYILQKEGITVPDPQVLNILSTQLQVCNSNRKVLERLEDFVRAVKLASASENAVPGTPPMPPAPPGNPVTAPV